MTLCFSLKIINYRNKLPNEYINARCNTIGFKTQHRRTVSVLWEIKDPMQDSV